MKVGAASGGARRIARRVVVGVLAGLVLAIVLRAFVVSVSLVPSRSMAPTLVAGDRVLVDRLAYLGSVPARGDVVEFSSVGGGREFVKRVAAIAGDTIEMRGGAPVLNGVAVDCAPAGEATLDEDGLPRSRARGISDVDLCDEVLGTSAHAVARARAHPGADAGPWVVPAGSVFVLGDNREESLDSRSAEHGPIALDRIVGRVTRIAVSSDAQGRMRWARMWAHVR